MLHHANIHNIMTLLHILLYLKLPPGGYRREDGISEVVSYLDKSPRPAKGLRTAPDPSVITLRTQSVGPTSAPSEQQYGAARLSYGDNPFSAERYADPYGAPANTMAVPKKPIYQHSPPPAKAQPLRQQYLTDTNLWEPGLKGQDNSRSMNVPSSKPNGQAAYISERMGELSMGTAAKARPLSAAQVSRGQAFGGSGTAAASGKSGSPGRKPVTIAEGSNPSTMAHKGDTQISKMAANRVQIPHVTHPFSSRAAPPDSPYISLPPSPMVSEGYSQLESSSRSQWVHPSHWGGYAADDASLHPFATRPSQYPESSNPFASRPSEYPESGNPFAAKPSQYPESGNPFAAPTRSDRSEYAAENYFTSGPISHQYNSYGETFDYDNRQQPYDRHWEDDRLDHLQHHYQNYEEMMPSDQGAIRTQKDKRGVRFSGPDYNGGPFESSTKTIDPRISTNAAKAVRSRQTFQQGQSQGNKKTVKSPQPATAYMPNTAELKRYAW